MILARNFLVAQSIFKYQHIISNIVSASMSIDEIPIVILFISTVKVDQTGHNMVSVTN